MKKHIQLRIVIWAAFAIVLVGCGSKPAAGTTEREVREFMAAYADDLRQHKREAIADRYDRRGAFMLGQGAKSFESFDTIKKGYQTNWSGPVSFEWEDLSVEVLSPVAAVVAGRFKWQLPKSEQPLIFSYTSLLVKESGQWRIRLEDESKQ